MFPGENKKILRESKINRLIYEIGDVVYDDLDIIEDTIIIDNTYNQNFTNVPDDFLENLLEREINKKISRYLFKHADVIVLDFIWADTSLGNTKQIFDLFIEDVDEYVTGNKNVVVNGLLGSVLQDSEKFSNHSSTFPKTTSNTFYSIGNFKKSEINIDAYMRWDDTRMLVYDNIGFYAYDYTIISPTKVEYNIHIDKRIKSKIKVLDFKNLPQLI